jgi:hypothetical protein
MLSAKKYLILFALLLVMTPLALRAAYVSTPRDTQPNPLELTDLPLESSTPSGFVKLGGGQEFGPFTFYWKESLDILAVYDSRNGYLWKSGLDVNPDVTSATQTTLCETDKRRYNAGSITFEQFKDRCEKDIDTITGTTTGPLQANSLLYFDYFSKGGSDFVFSTNTVHSSYRKTILYTVSSRLQMVVDTPNHYQFTVKASRLGAGQDLDLDIIADLYLSDEGFQIDILSDNITGTAKPFLSSIGVARYLGAVGGMDNKFSVSEKTAEVDGNYTSLPVQRPMIGGYSFVPDGSGALIRFQNNSVSLSAYRAYVYGDDPSQSEQNYQRIVGTFVPFKTASIPVFGMAHGNNQAAYVAYATSGAEFLDIISVPEENTYKYNSTHARFNYNFRYNKLFTLDGDNPVPSIYPTLNQFDVSIKYDFLAGDGSLDGYPANYVGMALKYRQHLINEGIIKPLDTIKEDIGIRLDFLMADSESSIVGYQTKVATTVNDMANILDSILAKGITNVSSGLLGWGSGGLTLGNPSKTVFDSGIGSKSAYTSIIKSFSDRGVDISFSQDYYRINEEQINLLRNAAKHPAGWYARVRTFEDPISVFYFSRPIKAVEWLNHQTNVFDSMGVDSYTIQGITNRLISDYTTEQGSRTQAIDLFTQAFEQLSSKGKINAVKPNLYLFPYVDRYLQMDVYNSQYLIMTDTVPFLQILLHNTMELYAIYSNFSFYTQSDVLRMIDYNVFPSFVLTEKPSYVLTHSNSSNFYSTEYTLYEELIEAVYNQVNGVLRNTLGQQWVNREILEVGVVKNTYSDGDEVLINYTDVDYLYKGQMVLAQSARFFGGE